MTRTVKKRLLKNRSVKIKKMKMIVGMEKELSAKKRIIMPMTNQRLFYQII